MKRRGKPGRRPQAGRRDGAEAEAGQALNPSRGSNDRLWTVCKSLPTDFEPWGTHSRSSPPFGDCSSECRYFTKLAGALGQDWGVCVNGASPRAGLLTFEHQGCPDYKR